MTASRVVPTMFCLALIGATFSPSAKADDYIRKRPSPSANPSRSPRSTCRDTECCQPELTFSSCWIPAQTGTSYRSSIKTKRGSLPPSWPSRTIACNLKTKRWSPLARQYKASRKRSERGSIPAQTGARNSCIRRPRQRNWPRRPTYPSSRCRLR